MTDPPELTDPAAARRTAEKMTKAEIVRELAALDVDATVDERKPELVEKLVDAWGESRGATEPDDAPVEIEGEVVKEEDEPIGPAAPEIVEEESRALALRQEAVVAAPALLPTTAEFDSMMTIATRVANTTMVPKAYRGKPDDVVAAILTGRELGLGPMQSLRDIHVVDGKPALSANLLLARMRANGIRILESVSTAERAWIRAQRRDTGEIAEVEWTYAEAEEVTYDSWEGPQGNRTKVRRRLVEKDNWQNYRVDMLWARAVGRLARRLGPDLIGAAMPYSSEEVQDWDEPGHGHGSTMDSTPVERPRTDVGRGGDGTAAWVEPSKWSELVERLVALLGRDEAGVWIREVAEKGYAQPTLADTLGNETEARQRDLWKRMCGILRTLDQTEGDLAFRPDFREVVSAAFGAGFDGAIAFEGPPWALSSTEAESGRPAKDPPEAAGTSPGTPEAEGAPGTPPDGEPVRDTSGDEIVF